MLTYEEAYKLVSKELDSRSSTLPLAIDDSATVEEPFGWIFYFTTRKYLETRDRRFRLIGNGPVIVNKITTEISFTGSNEPSEEIIDRLKREGVPPAKKS